MTTPDQLLADWGFVANPFRDTVAEREQGADMGFIRPSYYGDLIGDPRRPASAFIFGDRGDGKSKINRNTQKFLRMSPSRPLLVEYSDFTWLSRESLEHVGLDDHLERIITSVIDSFMLELVAEPTRVKNLDTSRRQTLRWYSLRYPPKGIRREREANLRTVLTTGIEGRWRKMRRGGTHLGDYLGRRRLEVERQVQEGSKIAEVVRLMLVLFGPSFSRSELTDGVEISQLGNVVQLIREAGFAGVLVFLDRVDEAPVTTAVPRLGAQVVRPLALSLPLLELDGFGIKFFLPTQVLEGLRPELRTDRILTREIKWTRSSLKEMLSKRLLAYSRDFRDSLDAFVDDEVRDDFEQTVFDYAANNPRNLLRILDHVVTECARSAVKDLGGKKVTRGNLKDGLRDFYRLRVGEEDGPRYLERLKLASPDAVPRGFEEFGD